MTEPALYVVTIKRSALRALGKLPHDVQARVFRATAALRQTPRPVGCKAMRGRPGHWRLRLGDYRVIYTIDDATVTIEVVEVGHRRDVYR